MEKTKIFVMWLDGYLEEKEDLNKEQVNKIRNKLNNIFEHEADKANYNMPVSQNYLDNNGPLVRC